MRSLAPVLATLEHARPAELELLAGALEVAGGTVARFALPLSYLATSRAYGEDAPGSLVLLSLRVALRVAALDGPFLERIEEASSPFWRAVQRAGASAF